MSHKLEHLPGECADAALRFGAFGALISGGIVAGQAVSATQEARRRRKRRSLIRLRPLPRGASLRRWAALLLRQSADMGFRGLLRFCSARQLPHGP
jgi:hypothetical protein